MDYETGEMSLADRETGELPAVHLLNSETGEKECNYTCPPQHRHQTRSSFRIPNPTPQRSTPARVEDETSAITPALMFFLPTAFFFNPLLALVLASAEVSCHIWTHKKNKALREKGVYYRSPLHLFVSQFCGSCREKNSADKINKIQEKRSKGRGCAFECVRQIVT